MSWIDEIVEKLPEIHKLCKANSIASLKMFRGMSSVCKSRLNLVYTEEADADQSKYIARVTRLHNGLKRLLGWEVSLGPEETLSSSVINNEELINLFQTEETPEEMLRTQLENIFGEHWQFIPAILPDTTSPTPVNAELPVLSSAIEAILNMVESEARKLPPEYHKEFFAKLYATVAISSAINTVVNQLEIETKKLPLSLRTGFLSQLSEVLQEKLRHNSASGEDYHVSANLTASQRQDNFISMSPSSFFKASNTNMLGKLVESGAEEDSKTFAPI